MLDIKYIRENTEAVKKGVASKNFDAKLVDKVLELDEDKRKLQFEIENLRAERNTAAKSKDIEKRLLKGEFNLVDLYEQMQAMSKMGSLSKLMELVPGMSQLKLPKEVLDVQEGKLKHWRYSMNSMTRKELEMPELIDGSRIRRISSGSGVPASEVRDLLKQYRMAKKMMSSIKGKDPEKLMRKFKGRIPGM